MSKSQLLPRRRVSRDPRKDSLWRKRLSAQAASGMSVRRFCRREGWAETAFYFWRREIALRDGEAASSRQRPGFVELRVSGPAVGLNAEIAAAPAAAVSPAAIELCLGCNRRLLIGVGFDAALLCRVVAALEGMPC